MEPPPSSFSSPPSSSLPTTAVTTTASITSTFAMTDTTSTQEEVAAYRIENVELSLQEATKERALLLAKIKATQAELDSEAKKGTRRPREKISELDERLKQLDCERTIVSIPLKQEKEILWQMSRVEKLKRQVEEYEEHETVIKSKKSELATLRNELRKLSERISALRIELSMAKKAKDLNCSVEELLGMKLDIPPEKLGLLIGKKGANIQQLREQENVSIDVGSKDGEVRILGPLSSLDATAMNIDQILARDEVSVDLPKTLVYFLTSKGIVSLAEIRDRNPDVEFVIDRASGKTKLRGVPDDIQSARKDLESVDIVEQTLTVTAKESAGIIGKQGANIDDMVARHQAAIEVTRNKDDESEATILIVGSLVSVKGAMEEMEDIMAQHKEETRTISIDQTLRDMLLTNKGAGVQALSKLVNDGVSGILPGSVSVVIEGLGVKLKGKALVMPKAFEIASDEIRLKEASIVRLEVHPSALPAMIGKGGAGIKKFKEGAESAIIELDRKTGHICICSLDNPHDTVKVAEAVNTFIENNQVRSVDLEPHLFQNQFRILLRSTTWKELNELVTVSRDDELFQILLRGTNENIVRAAAILSAFLEDHSQGETPVTHDDFSALLRGGKKSKIEQLSKDLDVRLRCDTDKGVVVITGKKEKIEDAKNAISMFLNGGEGVTVVRIAADDYSVGSLVGKAGATKSATEAKFPTVSISIPPNNTVILRGPQEDVNACQKYLSRLLVTGVTTEKLVFDEKMSEHSKSAEVRDKLKSLPIQTHFEESHVTIKGPRADVFYAAGLLKDAPGGCYENRILLEVSCFQKIQVSNQESHLSDVQNATRTRVDMDPTSSSISIKGKQENVVAAKTQMLQFLTFLLGEAFAFESIRDHSLNLFTQPARLGAIAEESGAFLYLDRDIGGVVISASDSESVKKAREVCNAKLSSLDKSIYKLDLGVDGDWLAPALIGKGGYRVKALRKSWECSVVISDSSVTLVCDDPEKLVQARDSLDKIVADERAQCFAAEVPNANMAAFVGEKGSNVKEFEERHNVQVKTTRNHRKSVLRISGGIDDVACAKLAFEEWLEQQPQQQGGVRGAAAEGAGAGADEAEIDLLSELYEFESSESILLRRLIGKNGKRINALRRRCTACRIDVDVDNLTLKITSKDKKRLDVAKGVVDRILEEERSQNAFIQLSNKDIPAFIGAKGARVKAFEAKHGVKVHIVKPDGGVSGGVNIAGEPEAIVEAKAGVEEWLAKRHEQADSDNKNSGDEMILNDSDDNPKPLFDKNQMNGSTPPRHPSFGFKTDKPRPLPISTPEKSEFPALVATETNDTVPSSHSWASMLNSPSKEGGADPTDETSGEKGASM